MTYKIIGVDGKEYGPVTTEQLREWAVEGRVNSQTQVLPENQTEWRTVAAVPELAVLIPVPQPTISPLPQTSSGGQPGGTNSLSVIALVLGLLSLPGVCCCYSLPFSIPGMIVSIIALMQFNKDSGAKNGKGLAIAGLVLSILGLMLGTGWLIFVVSKGGTDWLKQLRVR